jgi:hypothetical protein
MLRPNYSPHQSPPPLLLLLLLLLLLAVVTTIPKHVCSVTHPP